jgi:hypothetical protein
VFEFLNALAVAIQTQSKKALGNLVAVGSQAFYVNVEEQGKNVQKGAKPFRPGLFIEIQADSIAGAD